MDRRTSHRVRWMCTYEARSGGRARALFDSFEAAKRFAENHSQLSGGPTGDVIWIEVDGSWILSTRFGDYLVLRM